jgi:hypothetical protein
MSPQRRETCPIKDNFPAYTKCGRIVPIALATLAILGNFAKNARNPAKWS